VTHPHQRRLFSVATLLLFIAVGLTACEQKTPGPASRAPAAAKVSVALPVVKEIQETDEFTGRFEAIDDVEIRSRVAGYLQAVHFKDGALVKKGDLLFTIDPRPFQAEYENATAAVNVAQTKLDFAKDEFERAKQLQKSGTLSASVFDERRQQFLSSQGDLAGARAKARIAKLDLGYTKIYAPLSGRLSRKLLSVGNLVQANSTLLTTLVVLDPIHFYFDVDERSYLAYARQVRSGERISGREHPIKVKIKLSDEQRALHPGQIDFAENRIDRETGTMRVRAVVANQDLFLQPGLFGRLSVPGSPPYQGVLIPDAALASDQDRRIVYVLGPENKVLPRVVSPGPKIDGYRVIRKGLTGTETLVINGLMRIRPGVTVDPQRKELPLVATQPQAK